MIVNDQRDRVRPCGSADSPAAPCQSRRSHTDFALFQGGRNHDSIDRFKKLAKVFKAKVVIQHDTRDVGILPAYPAVAN